MHAEEEEEGKEEKWTHVDRKDRSGVREYVGRCHVGAIIKYDKLLQ